MRFRNSLHSSLAQTAPGALVTSGHIDHGHRGSGDGMNACTDQYSVHISSSSLTLVITNLITLDTWTLAHVDTWPGARTRAQNEAGEL